MTLSKTNKRNRVYVNGMETTLPEDKGYVKGAMVPIRGPNKNSKTLVKNFLSVNKTTGTFKVNGQYMLESDMELLLEYKDTILDIIQENRIKRAMSELGVTNKRQLKRVVAKL